MKIKPIIFQALKSLKKKASLILIYLLTLAVVVIIISSYLLTVDNELATEIKV